MRAVHGRMPLILQEDQIEDWLRDGKVTEEILRQVPMELVRTAKYEQMTLLSDVNRMEPMEGETK